MTTFDVSSAKTLNRENASVLYSLVNSLATKVYTDTSATVTAVTGATYTPLCGVNVPMALDDIAIAFGIVRFSIGDTAPTFSVALTGGGTSSLTVNSTIRAGVFLNGALNGSEAVQSGIANSTNALQQTISVWGYVRNVSGSQGINLQVSKNVSPGTATIYATGRIDIFVGKNGG